MTLVYKKYKCKTLVHKKYKCITLVYYQYIYTIHITIVYDWKGITLVYKTLLSSKDSFSLQSNVNWYPSIIAIRAEI